MAERTCDYCGAVTSGKKGFIGAFCCRDHYHAWRRENSTAYVDHEDYQRDYNLFKRGLWGGSGKGHNEVGAWAKPFGREFEKIAISVILPAEGFTEIVDLTSMSSQFYIDFVATRDNERVLVDVTTKWKAYVPKKRLLAEALRMKLFILHISPANPAIYHLAELQGISVARVPMSFFHQLATSGDHHG